MEVKDCTPKELRTKELNVGVYCFDVQALRSTLSRLSSDNAQGEYYLTDIVQLLSQDGQCLEALQIENLEEILGINDPAHLKFAGQLDDIAYAESLYELRDVVILLERNRSID